MWQNNYDDDHARLPPYARSLLKICVPVSVTLADSRQPIRKVVELTPGSIIQFEKACDQMLSLEVGGCQVAEGEAVKVGDKFGLRVTSITLPGERFRAVRKAGGTSQTPVSAGQTPPGESPPSPSREPPRPPEPAAGASDETSPANPPTKNQ